MRSHRAITLLEFPFLYEDVVSSLYIIFFDDQVNLRRYLSSSALLRWCAGCLAMIFWASVNNAFAFPSESYAASSRLASGKWAKVEVTSSGMQLISNSTLASLGFSDPASVNVYGYGGRMISENLDGSSPDDLPILPSIVTPDGIIFFGHSSVSWQPDGKGCYTHCLNPYSDKSFYFISDASEKHLDPGISATPHTASPADTLSVFTERTLHEKDLMAPATSGRILLGEDFRVQPTRSFKFNLSGICGDASMTVAFGAKVTNGTSSLLFKANGERLPATADDIIPGVRSSDTYYSYTTTSKVLPADTEIDLSIQFSNSGALFTAALDYIRITYPRRLDASDGELYFHVSPASESMVRITGCDSDIMIWDVTNSIAPQMVNHTLAGSEAFFFTPAGYHEYVAFRPSSIRREVRKGNTVANQDIHSAEVPDMLIITPPEYDAAARKIAGIHTSADSLSVAILHPEEIYNEFSSGVPDVSAFRKLLKMWHDRSVAPSGRRIRYCLILSRATYDNKGVTPSIRNAGYPRIPIWQSPDGFSSTTSYSTDDFIGMLEDFYPGWDMGKASINVAVGRMPVKNVKEAEEAAAKLEKYLLSPETGPWRNNVMLVADDQDNGTHLSQSETVYNSFRKSEKGSQYLYRRIYLDAFTPGFSGTGAVYPDAKRKMLSAISDGVLLWNYMGHASSKNWGHENLLTWSDISGMTNSRLPFLYAATCEFLRWDADETSGGEEMWLLPKSGIIGMICPSRTVYISLNGPLNAATAEFMFSQDVDGKYRSIGDIMIAGKNSRRAETNKLRYCLLGDPAMRLPIPTLNAVVDSIAGQALGVNDEMPVIPALSSARLAGRITDHRGNIVDDFNGPIHIRTLDAEKIIRTNGNGETGKEMIYNDRTNLLFVGKANVIDGRWSAVMTIPSEIENNYSPGLISLYASDLSGREANGASEQFFVYGFNRDAPDDTDPPLIDAFYLNSPAFTDGASVGPAPVVKASFFDESGINVSDAGIGRSMTLCLDGKTFFNNVSSCYIPDTTPGSGSIAYPLQGIDAGSHTLDLTVWDNAGNAANASLKFKVDAAWSPGITSLGTDVNPATADVNFLIDTDADGAAMLLLEVFDLNGRKVWAKELPATGPGTLNVGWNLCDKSGTRVPRGIYPYRATITSSSGQKSTKNGKLAVTGL